MQCYADTEVILMANTSAVYARIDKNLKERAELVLQQLGITPSSAIQMLYSQIIRTKSLPLDLRLTYRKPLVVEELSPVDLDKELQRGFDSVKQKAYSADEVDDILKKEFNI